MSGRIAEENKFTKLGQFHTLDLELQRNFTLEKSEGWDSIAIAVVKEACDPTKTADVWAVVMQEGLANLAVLTGSRTVLRQRVEMAVPKKRGGNAGDHDKVNGNQETSERALGKLLVLTANGVFIGDVQVLSSNVRYPDSTD